MDLPFAVDFPERGDSTMLGHSSSSSLMMASGSPSFFPSEQSGVYTKPQQQQQRQEALETETIDFTFVHAESDADEVDVVIDGGTMPNEGIEQPKGDILAVLLSGTAQQNGGEYITIACEQANEAAHQASEAKKNGDLNYAFNEHSRAANLFREAAVAVRDQDVSLSNSLLLLSQAQAKSALVFKRFIRKNTNGKNHPSSDSPISSAMTQKERLRATVRGALVTKNEADISDSMFLGKATLPHQNITNRITSDESHNPVDEMMELERELRDMDMALELGNSVASLGTRTQNRMKQSTMEDGSFMVVPPGSSYMSSSLWTPSRPTLIPRARPNRVQHILGPSTAAAILSPPTHASQRPNPASSGLESSWWGSGSTASHMMASSVVSMTGGGRHHGDGGLQQPTNTKQLMRLLDSIKTLGDENAALLREVEEAEAARIEAKAAKDQMHRFKEEYSKRFSSLKSALEKFRKGYPEDNTNPVISSEFIRTSAESEEHRRQEQTIRRLTMELKREKDESKKKDAALRKYESFYREVKARSAQKAAERQKDESQRLQRPIKGPVPRVGSK